MKYPQKQIWNALYSKDWALLPWASQQTDFFKKAYIDRFIMPQDTDVLEYGCGTGSIAYYLSAKGHNVLAAEYSDIAVEGIKAQKPPFEIIQVLSPDDIKLKKFNAITSFAVLHHQPPKKMVRFLESFSHLLKPGGKNQNISPVTNSRTFPINHLEDVVPKLGLRICNSETHPYRNEISPGEKNFLLRYYTLEKEG